MDATTAHDVLGDVRAVRQRVRGDRRATSVPLLIFGTITLIEAFLRPFVHASVNDIVAVVLAPLGFAAVAIFYRRHEVSIGVGSPTRAYGLTGLGLALALTIFLGLILLFGTFAVVGVGLLIIALRQRNFYLGIWAAIYGVVGTLESFYLISNRIAVSWSPSLVYGVLGAMLIGAGLLVRRNEVGAR